MNIDILAFGIAKDLIGKRLTQMTLEQPVTIADLKKELIGLFPDFQKLSSFSIAVNEEYQNDDYFLQPNDEVAIIPPVSGG